MKEHTHISEEKIIAFQLNILTPEDTEEFLTHICSCDFCSGLFAESFTKDMVSAPPDMKENILNAVKSPRIQIVQKAKDASKQMQLLLYSLKVGTATLGALLLLLLTLNFGNGQTAESVRPPESAIKISTSSSFTNNLRDNMDALSNSLSKFSNIIMNTEVNNNAKKEK
ncbi:MAG TPA: hypothetical protein VJZ06_08140 [Mobilitalea sp.]|nr:hypothetical protein [Mobilitalea sp.]